MTKYARIPNVKILKIDNEAFDDIEGFLKANLETALAAHESKAVLAYTTALCMLSTASDAIQTATDALEAAAQIVSVAEATLIGD